MSSELVVVEPRELKFVFELKKQIPCKVQLTNNSDHYVAFKVKTTSPKRYSVRPNGGIILPRSAVDFTVTLQPQRVAPDMPCRDKFLVQSTVVPFGTKEEEINPEHFSKESGRFIEEYKLKVAFVITPHSPTMQRFDESFKREKSFKEPTFEAPTLKEIGLDAPIAEESHVPKENPAEKESSFLEEAPVITKVHLRKDLEPTRSDNALMDVEELKLKLRNLEAKLNETLKANSLLVEEKTLVVQERDKLQKEVVILRRKQVDQDHKSYPILVLCFIGLTGAYLGYLLRW